MAVSCDWFEFDNYDAPNAQITGKFIDAKTGELVAQECTYGNMFGGMVLTPPDAGYISAYQLHYDYEAAVYWYAKYDGSYTNTQIFAGEYRLVANANNFYAVTKDNVMIKEGENVLDWEVTPYCRIVDPKIEYVGGKIKATFKVELGDPTKANVATKAILCCYPDKFVGIKCNYCADDPEASTTTVVADGTTVHTLYIDPTLEANANEFKYKNRTHYLRLAVVASGNGENTANRYNYTQTTSIKF